MLYKVVEIHVTTCDKGHSKLLEAASTVSSLVSSFLLRALTQARLAYPVPEPVYREHVSDVRGGGVRGLG